MRWMFLLFAVVATAQINYRPDGSVDFRRAGQEPVSLGVGLIETPRVPGAPLQANVNLGVVSYRVQPPATPGLCMPHGSSAWAADRQYLYVCVPNEARTDFVWARLPLQVTW